MKVIVIKWTFFWRFWRQEKLEFHSFILLILDLLLNFSRRKSLKFWRSKFKGNLKTEKSLSSLLLSSYLAPHIKQKFIILSSLKVLKKKDLLKSFDRPIFISWYSKSSENSSQSYIFSSSLHCWMEQSVVVENHRVEFEIFDRSVFTFG